MNRRCTSKIAAAVLATLLASAGSARADLTFSLAWGWQPDGTADPRRDAAWWALNNTIARFNAYGDFTAGNSGNVQGAYNPGVPTAQAGYGGWGGIIEYGGTWPNDRVTQHELNHWLGSGTYAHTYDGPRAIAMLEQFDGVGARFGTDGTHFWPYGFNYDNEWSDIAAQRNVAILYALRADWGIGSAANPEAWNATSVTLSGSDAGGQSGFNFGNKWSDGTFAHANADYSTGAYDLRTPNGYPSWTFAGKSLTVNQGGRLLYNSWGNDGRITVKNLTLNNGTVRQDQYDGNPNVQLDTFRLAGNVNVVGNSTFEAAEGDIYVEAAVSGSGSLTKTGGYALTLQAANSYAGATNINQGTLRLAPTKLVADYTFDNVSGSTVVNGGSGGTAMNGTLANGAAIVAAGGGRAGNAVRLSNGASVDINSGITDLGTGGSWAVSAWVNTTTPGATILSKGDGGWNYGNTIFYLGDGADGGSGSQPAGVRWAGGFVNAQPGSASVTDGAWHQVTYVNTGGTYTIYVDGTPLATAANNASFGVRDVGSIVKLGLSTNTFAGDGTVNFNGLMDSVQFYGQSLSSAQVAALFAGKKLGALPTSTVVTIANGASLDLGGTAQEVAGLSGVAGSNVSLNGGQLIVNAAADSTFAGSVTGGGGSIVKTGAGTLTLTAGNSYADGTTINAGTLQINGQWALGGSVAGGLTFNGGALKYVANLPGTNGSADVSQDPNGRATPVTINAGGATIDTNGNNVTFAQPIGNNGAGGLTKAGAGRLVLNGTNTYAGATAVNAGTLRVLGSIAASAGVTVNSGATLEGTGTASAVTLNAGGKVSPGVTIGTLTASSLLWNSDNTTAGGAFDLALPGTSDQLVLGSLIKGSGGRFLFDLTGGTIGQTYTLITFATNAGPTGAFAAADFGLASTSLAKFGVFSVDGDSVDFTLLGAAPVPEPTSATTLCVATGLAAAGRRQRRRSPSAV